MDARCARLIAGTEEYHALAGQLTEKYLAELCYQHHLPLPLCTGDFDVLVSVFTMGESAGMTEIARKLGIHPSSVTRNVKKLMENGLVSKVICPSDERRFQLALTEKGDQLCREMDAKMEAAVRQMYADVTPEQMQMVFDFSDHCVESLKKLLREC